MNENVYNYYLPINELVEDNRDMVYLVKKNIKQFLLQEDLGSLKFNEVRYLLSLKPDGTTFISGYILTFLPTVVANDVDDTLNDNTRLIMETSLSKTNLAYKNMFVNNALTSSDVLQTEFQNNHQIYMRSQIVVWFNMNEFLFTPAGFGSVYGLYNINTYLIPNIIGIESLRHQYTTQSYWIRADANSYAAYYTAKDL